MVHKITLSIAHHHNEITPYLELLLESLSLQDGVDLDVVIMDSRVKKTEFETFGLFPKIEKISHNVIAPVAYNAGFKKADSDSRFFMVVNDDVCFARGALKELVESAASLGGPAIINGLSNCDLGIYFQYPGFSLSNESESIKVKNQMSLEEVLPFKEQLLNQPLRPRILFRTHFNCFYATLIDRNLWETLGGFDEAYRSGPDDLDFCLQAQRINIHSFINMAPTVWHFSGRTMEVKDKAQVEKDRAFNREHFKKKWGRYP